MVEKSKQLKIDYLLARVMLLYQIFNLGKCHEKNNAEGAHLLEERCSIQHGGCVSCNKW